MKITEKINRSRYTLKEILSNEWDTSVISDYSLQEIDKLYTGVDISDPFIKSYGNGFICNIKLQHKIIDNHYLHVVYFNFPELSPDSSLVKVTKKNLEKIDILYKEGYFNINDSVIVVINETVSESISKSVDNLNVKFQNDLSIEGLDEEIIKVLTDKNMELNKEYNIKHFKNIHILDIDSLTNNLLKHRLVPKHIVIRNKEEINKILSNCNATINQLPIILKNDIIAKLTRMVPGDVCEIKRINDKCGENNFYRVCK
uniref:RNA polymerase subunit H/Rpb5 C-terminal domain-containing protein n=1 Tax=viral metagenome TaxID=1070528 RepID=A0A6C0C5A9_9ZZZZ